jgi:chromosome segregation ATPase
MGWISMEAKMLAELKRHAIDLENSINWLTREVEQLQADIDKELELLQKKLDSKRDYLERAQRDLESVEWAINEITDGKKNAADDGVEA